MYTKEIFLLTMQDNKIIQSDLYSKIHRAEYTYQQSCVNRHTTNATEEHTLFPSSLPASITSSIGKSTPEVQ